MASVIVGRVTELGVADTFLADRLAEPRALLIDGEPGIGKTTLLRELVAMARARGHHVLSCRPTRSEMDLSYVGLVELLAGVPDGIVGALPPPQTRLLRMILRKEEPQGAFDRLSLGLATVAAVEALAAAGPLLLAVDDVQWLDPATAKTLAFVVRRLAGTATRVAVAVRRDEAGDRLAEIAQAMPEGRFDRVGLGPVDAGDLSRILRRAIGWAPAWPRMVRIAELSGGNPLHAVELARALGGAGADEDLERSLPAGVVELARSRIAGLPEPVRETVQLASVPHAPTLALLDRLTTDPESLRGALDQAERTRIVTVDGERIRFAHPILAAAAYGSIPADRRRELHRAVAMLSTDLEERARHLARAAAGPDPEVAAVVASAAELAWRRGAPDAAADLMRLACRLTPDTDLADLVPRRIAYGRLRYSAGDTPGALVDLESLVAGLPPGQLRARALFHLMYVARLTGSLGRAMEHGTRAAAEATDDPSFQAAVYELLSRLSDDDIARKLDTARRALAAVGRAADPDPHLVFHAQAAMVEAEFYAGFGIHLDRLDGLEPADRPQFPPVRTALNGEDLVGRVLTFAGHIDEGLAVLRKFYDRAAIESRATLPAILGWMAEAEIMAGRFDTAEELAREANERTVENGADEGMPWQIGFRAVALARLGRLDEAEATAAGVVRQAEAEPTDGMGDDAPARLALGLVASSRGEFGMAADHLRRLDEAKRATGIREPRLVAHASDFVEALVGAGELAEAAEVLARFEEDATRSGGQWSRAAAARCRALLLAAEGRLDEAYAAAERSLTVLGDLPMRFEHARTWYVVGQVHRRRKEKRLAREALTRAYEEFEALGARVWARRAGAELTRIPRRQAGTGLTPTEETIARLAAAGLTNREIADRAFLSPKTVEVNLTRIYRKLGVRSRAELAGRFAVGRDESGPAG